MSGTNTDPSTNPPSPKFTEQDFIKLQEKLDAVSTDLLNKNKELETIKANDLKTQNNYKELYEATQKKYEESEKKYLNLAGATVKERKYNEVEKLAIAKGIRKEALDDLKSLDLKEVVVETTNTGKINIIGASNYVDNLFKSRPHWFTDQSPPKVNNGSGSFTPENKLSARELLDLQKKDPVAYKNYYAQRSQKGV